MGLFQPSPDVRKARSKRRFFSPKFNLILIVLFEVASSICSIVAIITTILRLYIRSRRSRLWVDDVSYHISRFRGPKSDTVAHSPSLQLLAISGICALIAQMFVIFTSPRKPFLLIHYMAQTPSRSRAECSGEVLCRIGFALHYCLVSHSTLPPPQAYN